MIDQLPQELLEQILGYLPTASSITNVSQANRKLYAAVRKGENVIFHDFVKRQFPTIAAEPPWLEAGLRLTSRSRAWDRRAFVARECVPPRAKSNEAVQNGRNQTFGFMPVIDSYETVDADQPKVREVLAWGAGGRIVACTTKGKSIKWSSFSFPEDDRPENDILDLRLLRPHQNRNQQGESMFIRRANRELALLHWTPGKNDWVVAATYLVPPETAIDCVDLSEDADPLIAVCNSGSIHLFPLHTSKAKNHAMTVLLLAETATTKQRKRCAKFLSSSRIAIAPQYLEGRQPAPIEIFDTKPTESPSTHIQALQQLEPNILSGNRVSGRIGANVLARVDKTGASDSDLLLSGWSDGVVRLYDLQTSHNPIREFSDPVDDGQIFSVLPIGQERFLAGSHQNGCLKTFDMRLDGRVYDYTSAIPNSHESSSSGLSRARRSSGRDINIFLAVTTQRGAPPSRPLHLQRGARASTYRGSLYSLSSPSPSSPTVYVGIENHVVQLDFINSDDLQNNRGGIRDHLDDRHVLNLSCYERPRLGHESTDPVLLRKQTWQKDLSKTPEGNNVEAGWDECWHMERLRASKEKTGSWRLPARPSRRRGSASRTS